MGIKQKMHSLRKSAKFDIHVGGKLSLTWWLERYSRVHEGARSRSKHWIVNGQQQNCSIIYLHIISAITWIRLGLMAKSRIGKCKKNLIAWQQWLPIFAISAVGRRFRKTVGTHF